MTEDDQLPYDGAADEAESTDIDPAALAPAPVSESAANGFEQVIDDTALAAPPIEGVEGPEPVGVDEASSAPADGSSGDIDAVQGSPAADVGEPSSEAATSVPEPEALGGPEPKPAPPVAPMVEVTRSAPRALYFLTNRMNLNGVLGSRLVAPRDSHAKYYFDLLEQVPGWVPLLTQPPPQALIEAVTVERGAGTPTLIEFPLSVVKRADLKTNVVYVPALALSQAVAIHFREERDLREHRARGYKNIHAHDDLLNVTPELFASDASGEVVLDAPAHASQVNWQRLDRIRGAINGALAAVQSGEQLAVAAAFLGAAKFPASVSHPNWISWREVDDHGRSEDRLMPDYGMPDHVGFRSAYEVLGERDVSDAWSPNEVLDSVVSRIREAGLEMQAADALIHNFQRVRSIVNVEIDFEPFRSTARGLVSAKALLLVLLRPELEELLTWPDEQTGADDLTRVTAALLAGRLRGLAREATTLRSLALDDLTAAWAVRVAQGKGGALGKVQFAATTRETSLKFDGIEWSRQNALMPDPVVRYQKVAAAKREVVRIAVSRAVGWPVKHRLTVPSEAITTEEDGVLTILTPDEVDLEISVDEDEFLTRLRGLTGTGKIKALAAFDLRKR